MKLKSQVNEKQSESPNTPDNQSKGLQEKKKKIKLLKLQLRPFDFLFYLFNINTKEDSKANYTCIVR